MKELILLCDSATTRESDIQLATQLITNCSHIDYIQLHLPEGIGIAWVDKETSVLELI